MKKYDCTMVLSCDENGSNCIADIGYFAEAGEVPIDVKFDQITGNDKQEVRRRAEKMVQDWIHNHKE